MEMAGAVLRMRTCVIVLVLLLTTISVACAADQTVTLRLGALRHLRLKKLATTSAQLLPTQVSQIGKFRDRSVDLVDRGEP
jgi:hypothetical protein